MVKKKQKKQKTFSLKLTQLELLHIRDLFNIALPTDMQSTVSQSLAFSQERPLVEIKLWQKIAEACAIAKIPLNEDAPDFIVATAGLPPLGVFRMADNMNDLNPQLSPNLESKAESHDLFESLSAENANSLENEEKGEKE